MEHLFARSDSAKGKINSTYRRPTYAEIDWTDPLVSILGARGVGKTTLLIQRLQELDLPASEAVYIELGDLYFTENRLLDFAEEFLRGGGKYLFIDEVHRYGLGTWAQELKSIYDFYSHRLQVVFTGSSVVKILNEQADLSRRVLSYFMHGLSFREYLQLEGIAKISPIGLPELLSRHLELTEDLLGGGVYTFAPQLSAYFKHGYYPFYLNNLQGYNDRLNNVISLVINQDLPAATGARSPDTSKVARLLYAIASSVPFIPNISKLSERTGINRQTLLEYLEVMERANLIHSLRSAGKGVAALGKPDKIYLDNPNLVYALAPQQATIGTVRETFFLNQLSTLTKRAGILPPEIHLPKAGDFSFLDREEKFVFEIGGANKGSKQIGTSPHHYVVRDVPSTSQRNFIPLWLFGLLY